MNILTSTFARKRLLNNGKPINERTFETLIDAGIVRVAGMFAGKRIFDQDEIDKVAKLMPKAPRPSRYGIVDFIREQMKKRKASR